MSLRMVHFFRALTIFSILLVIPSTASGGATTKKKNLPRATPLPPKMPAARPKDARPLVSRKQLFSYLMASNPTPKAYRLVECRPKPHPIRNRNRDCVYDIDHYPNPSAEFAISLCRDWDGRFHAWKWGPFYTVLEPKYPIDIICDCGQRLCDPRTTKPTTTTTTTKPTTTKKQTTKKAPNPPPNPKTTAKLKPPKPPTKKPTTNPNKKLSCYSCESTQGDSSSACKDNPKTIKIVFCDPGHVCRTVSYVSEARGGSVVIRGCVDPKNIQNLMGQAVPMKGKAVRSKLPPGCVANPPYLPIICDTTTDCDYQTCDCQCSTNLCNNKVGLGQGWDICRQ